MERLEVDERVDVELGFRKQPGPSGKPGKSRFPASDCIRIGRVADLSNRV